MITQIKQAAASGAVTLSRMLIASSALLAMAVTTAITKLSGSTAWMTSPVFIGLGIALGVAHGTSRANAATRDRGTLARARSSDVAMGVYWLAMGIMIFSAGGFVDDAHDIKWGAATFFVLAVVAFFVSSQSAGIIERALITRIRRTRGADDHGAWMVAKLNEKYAKNPDPLLSGDLRAAAEARWPVDQHGHLYTPAPADLDRSIFEDGRLITGDNKSFIAQRQIDVGGLAEIYRADERRSMSIIAALAAAAMLIGFAAVSGSMATASAAADKINGQRIEAKFGTYDYFEPADVDAANSGVGRWVKNKSAIIGAQAMAGTAGLGVAAALLAFAYFLGMYRAFAPRNARSAVKSVIGAHDWLFRETKEEIVRWKYRLESRAMERAAYAGQLRNLRYDKTPTVSIGHATGMARFRGGLNTYLEGQQVALSFNDLSQNLLVLGGTGQGKTRYVLNPIMRSIMTAPRDGGIKKIAMYVADGKGVLWQDAKKIADETGAKIRVVGVERGEYGVDLFEGLPPHIVSEALGEAMQQASPGTGAGEGAIWMDLAKRVVHAATVIARVYEVTDDGLAEISATGERIYSPAGIDSLVQSWHDQQGRMHRAIKSICDAVDSVGPTNPAVIAEWVTSDLWAAVNFVLFGTRQYHEAGWGSIMLNVTAVLGGFTTLRDIRHQFGAAASENMLDIGGIWDDHTITATRLSPVEYGASARVVNVLVKLRVYHMARVRQLIDGDVGFREKLAVVIDECQDIITAGSGGFAETSFLNYSRSTGCMFIMATQGVPAIRAALGEASGGQKSENLLQQFRSKLFLQIEDPETVKLAQSLTGKALRSYTFDAGHYESVISMAAENGIRIENLPATKIDADQAAALVGGGTPKNLGIDISGVYANDMRFYGVKFKGGSLGHPKPAVDMMEKMKSIVWRAEDRNLSYFQQGNHEADLVRQEDLFQTGREHAFAYIQRAGHARFDFIQLASEK